MIFHIMPSNRIKKVATSGWLLVGFIIVGLLVGIQPLQADDAVVGNGAPGSCTEAAFVTALTTVQNSGSGTVTFNCGVAVHIIEFFGDQAGKLISNANVTIDGGNKIILNAYNERRHFYVASNATLTLQNIILIQGRNNNDHGGAIYNLGGLTLENTTIRDSNVDIFQSSGARGGAIASVGGPVTITNSLIENNTGGSAGGLYLDGETADATITGSIFRNNRTTNASFGLGGAITTWSGSDVTINSSTLEGNDARYGGAIYNEFATTTIVIEASTELITNTATIHGGGIFNAGMATVSGNSTVSRNMASFAGGGIFNDGGTILVSDGALSGNSAGENGGGIWNFNNGTVTVSTSTISDNSAPYGGGIRNSGTLEMGNSTLSGNSASNTGGGILNTGTVTVSNSTISDNSAGEGGGIINSGNITVSNSTLSDNSAPYGGGIRNSGTLELSNSTLSGNSASNTGGGILNSGTVTVSNSTISDNSAGEGGGIINSGNVTVSNSTLSDNSAVIGGGIINLDTGTLTVSNSTLSGNTASSGGGGGILNAGTVTVNSSTLSFNSSGSGGGIYHFTSGTATVSNSIIANSSNGGDCVSELNPITDGGHNLVEDNSCGFTGGSDPLLGPLADNGGPTWTHALLPGSPAIDAGDTDLTSDQRGVPRPQGAADDIGAVEVILFHIFLPVMLR